MKVLLIDVDSTIPNLALMKISAYHKALGNQVGLNVSDPDEVYASAIFKASRHKIDGLRFWYPNAQIHVGGTGIDLTSKLPDEIEQLRPDYSLYPSMDYSMGFTTRGCNNHCYFCWVPKKQGKLKRAQHPSVFHDPKFRKIMLMDNNWLQDMDWFYETSNWIIDNHLLVRENGMEVSLLDDDNIEQLKRMTWYHPIHFAYDQESDWPDVKRGIELLKKHGMNIRQNVEFYVYVNDNKDHDSGVERCERLKAEGTNAYIMFNIEKTPDQPMVDLERWANCKWIYWSCSYREYKKRRKVVS